MASGKGNLCLRCPDLLDSRTETQVRFTPDSPVAELLALNHLSCVKRLIQQRPESMETLIVGAAAFGHQDCLKLILSEVGLEALIGKEKLATKAVHMAARRGQCEALQLLLDTGIHPDVRLDAGPPGLTATYLAAANGHPQCLNLLLEAGGRGSLVPGISPLYGAVINKHMDCALLLLENKVWGRDQAGELMRRLASEGNLTYLTTIAKSLSELGLQELHLVPSARSIHIPKLKDDIQIAARQAARAGQADCLKVLLHSAFSDIYSISSVQDLIYDATSTGSLNCLVTIFECAILVNVDDSVVVAAQMGHLSCLQMLCDFSAVSLSARDQAVLESSTNGHFHCLCFLLEYSTQFHPDPICALVTDKALVGTSAKNYFECLTTLFRSIFVDAESCSDEAVQKAVLASAEAGHINCLSLIYVTLKEKISFEAHYGAIERAAISGRTECLSLVLQSRFNFGFMCPCHAGSRLRNAFEKAAVYGHYDCVVILEADNVTFARDSSFLKRHLVIAAALGNCEVMTILLKLGMDPNGPATPAYFGREDQLKWWKENVWEVYKSSQYEPTLALMDPDEIFDANRGEAPLLAAVKFGKTQCAKVLLSRGAKPNTMTNTGDSPLIYAARRGQDDLVRLLLQHGALPDLCHGSTQTTALEYAAKYNHPECVKLLLQYNARVDLAFRFGQTYGLGIKDVFGAAGCDTMSKAPGYRDWIPYAKSNNLLQYFCRSTIRKQIVEHNPKSNLFYTVQKLPLPANIQKFLLFCS